MVELTSATQSGRSATADGSPSTGRLLGQLLILPLTVFRLACEKAAIQQLI
jgi:hypothetical protein